MSKKNYVIDFLIQRVKERQFDTRTPINRPPLSDEHPLILSSADVSNFLNSINVNSPGSDYVSVSNDEIKEVLTTLKGMQKLSLEDAFAYYVVKVFNDGVITDTFEVKFGSYTNLIDDLLDSKD